MSQSPKATPGWPALGHSEWYWGKESGLSFLYVENPFSGPNHYTSAIVVRTTKRIFNKISMIYSRINGIVDGVVREMHILGQLYWLVRRKWRTCTNSWVPCIQYPLFLYHVGGVYPQYSFLQVFWSWEQYRCVPYKERIAMCLEMRSKWENFGIFSRYPMVNTVCRIRIMTQDQAA